MLLEQNNCSIPLADWLLLYKRSPRDLTGPNGIARNDAGESLDTVSGKTPLLTFIHCPDFRTAQRCSDFSPWQATTFSRFKDLFEQGQLVAFEYLQSRVDNVNVFQYNQMKNLVGKVESNMVLRKYLTKLELLIEILKKTLSKIYSLLLSIEDDSSQ